MVAQIKGLGRRKSFLSIFLVLTIPSEFIYPVAAIATAPDDDDDNDSCTDIRTGSLGFPVWVEDTQLSGNLWDYRSDSYSAHRLSKYWILSLSAMRQILLDYDPTL